MINSPLLLLTNIHNTLLLLLVAFYSLSAAALHPTNETDKLALLAFKGQILYPSGGVMDSWNESSHFCSWRGVWCSERHQGRVIRLNLAGEKLVGPLSPYIGNLSFIRYINISHNQFKGEIPQELGHLFRLRALDFRNNNFQGKIPSNLSSCLHLEFINFDYNELTGEIPPELDNLSNSLQHLLIYANQLVGSIPRWLGNESLLLSVALGRNNLHGHIPDELGRLAKLQLMVFNQNHLSGKIPLSMFNLSSLYLFDVGVNQLHGSIPPDIGSTLPNLEGFYVTYNHLYGQVPPSLVNATKLDSIDLGTNSFSGVVPSDFGKLSNLKLLSLPANQLESAEGEGLGFITSLTNCSNLRILLLGYNRFKGEFPASIANLSSKLELLALGGNQISGEIPKHIANLIGLTVLDISNNSIPGDIPSSIAKLSNLSILFLDDNKLSGSIPPSIGNLTRLLELGLSNNSLTGVIPPGLGNCSQLERLELSGNYLNGTVPKQLFSLHHLTYLELRDNYLVGQFPSEVGELIILAALSVSNNLFSGSIPSTLGKCSMLEQLWIDGNRFEGGIPSSFSSLKSLKALYLGENNLSGEIPEYFQGFTLLEHLNLSFNNFRGELPTGGVFGNASAISVTGNQGLCGGILQLGLPPCRIRGKGKFHRLKVVISVAIACSAVLLLAVVFLVVFTYRRKLSRRRRASIDEVQLQLAEGFPKISYAELRDATNDFSSSNLLGEGSFGSVYKGILGRDRMSVAVKVLNLSQKGASKSFIAECEALRNVRHRNLIKIVTVCSSVDSKGADFKALVYELMQNGSLEEWLHTKYEQDQDGDRSLSFIERLNIAIEVASAIEYLHDHCQPPIAHGDLKPSNILLDEDMVAHVGDFGLARFLASSQNSTSSIGINGTIGYLPPEYGKNQKASKPGDVYGFGILLLEMITGKRPTDAIFKDGFTIHQLAKTSAPKRMVDILEPSLLQEVQGETPKATKNTGSGLGILESVEAVLRIGVFCSMDTPNERMEMKKVVAELSSVRDKFLDHWS